MLNLLNEQVVDSEQYVLNIQSMSSKAAEDSDDSGLSEQVFFLPFEIP